MKIKKISETVMSFMREITLFSLFDTLFFYSLPSLVMLLSIMEFGGPINFVRMKKTTGFYLLCKTGEMQKISSIALCCFGTCMYTRLCAVAFV